MKLLFRKMALTNQNKSREKKKKYTRQQQKNIMSNHILWGKQSRKRNKKETHTHSHISVAHAKRKTDIFL